MRNRVFISYSHIDKEWLVRLRIHLRPLERATTIEIWDDTRIASGALWRDEIATALAHTRVAVLLISADFLASEFIASDELPLLLRAAEEDGGVILPVIVSPSRFVHIPSLACFQTVNPPSDPLVNMTKGQQEAVLVRVSEAIEACFRSQAPCQTPVQINSESISDPGRSDDAGTPSSDGQNDGGIAVGIDECTIELRIDRPFETYSDAAQDKLLKSIKELLGLGNVKIVSRRRGSVLLRLALTHAQAEQLLYAVKAGHFESEGLHDAEIIEDSGYRISDPHEFLKLSSKQLEKVFTNCSAGPIPIGEGEGTAIIAPGTPISDAISKFVHLFSWKGKVFERDPTDVERGRLKNRLLLLGTKAIIAEVYKDESWFDQKECIVLDYSHTSLVAQWVRDEIREVSPGVYLGIVFWGKEKEHAHKLIHFALKF